MKKGFDNELYVKLQSEKILERIQKFGGKLYLEFGGKLFDDLHAYRVMPGFEMDAKCKILLQLKDQSEIIFVISAADIERNKIRADFGIPYGADVLRLVDKIRALGLLINSIVVTQYTNQPAADNFINKLHRHGIKTYIHHKTKGYPTQVDVIVSDEGYGANPYIETTRPLVVVTRRRGRGAANSPPVFRSCITNTSAASGRVMQNSKPFPYGAFPCATPSTWRTRRRRRISGISI